VGTDDIDDRRRAIALFRHAVIADLDYESLPRGELTVRIVLLAQRTFRAPGGVDRTFTERTLWSWWSAYSKRGLAGLMPKCRADSECSKAISSEVLEAAIACRREVPTRSTMTIIDILIKQGVVAEGQLHRSTLDHHLSEAGWSRRRIKTLGTKRFIKMMFDRPNQLWVGDYHDARLLFDPATDRFIEVHVCVFIDHYSKVVVHAQWYLRENVATLEDTLKKALLKRGRPDRIYVDWGAAYRSDDFAFALDHLSIKLVHSKAYQSEGRGTIERFNRTIVEQFEPEVRALRISSLDELNRLFEAWVEQRYHLEIHGATEQRPVDRFAQEGFTPRYADPVDIDDTFRVRVSRKVHPKTSTVEVDGVAFVVETFLRNRWVTVHYDPHDLRDVLVFFRKKRVQRAFPQKPNEHPLPHPERPQPSPPSFDYLSALRAEYDARVVAEARKLSLSAWTPSDAFTLPAFLDVCVALLGKDLAPYERDELTTLFRGVGPFSEATTRLALEHALRLRGRGLHVSVYSHYLKVFHLEAIRSLTARKGSHR
jgi:transposase InsO family protein